MSLLFFMFCQGSRDLFLGLLLSGFFFFLHGSWIFCFYVLGFFSLIKLNDFCHMHVANLIRVFVGGFVPNIDFKFQFYFILFFKDFIYLFLEREERREKEREINISVWLPLAHPRHVPWLGSWPAIQARALTGNWTSNPLVRRPVLNPLSHTRQGSIVF